MVQTRSSSSTVKEARQNNHEYTSSATADSDEHCWESEEKKVNTTTLMDQRIVGTSTKKLEVTANEDNDNNAIINRSDHFEPSVVLKPCFEMKEECLPGVHKQSFSDQFQFQQFCPIMELDGPENWHKSGFPLIQLPI